MNGTAPNFLLHDLHSSSNGGVPNRMTNGQVTTGYNGQVPDGMAGGSTMGLTVNPFLQHCDPQIVPGTHDRLYSPEDLVSTLHHNTNPMYFLLFLLGCRWRNFCIN